MGIAVKTSFRINNPYFVEEFDSLQARLFTALSAGFVGVVNQRFN